MATVFIARKTIGAVKKRKFDQSVASTLNTDLGDDNGCKVLCISDVTIDVHVNTVTGRPALLPWMISSIKSYLKHNRKMLILVQDAEGEKVLLALEKGKIDETAAMLNEETFKEAHFDNGFASDRGLHVLKVNNTKIVKGKNENQYFVYPKSGAFFKKSFEVNIIIDNDQVFSEQNAKETKTALDEIVNQTQDQKINIPE